MKGVSPVVATVLLIAIAVIASTTTWYWVSSYTSKPALAETTLKSYVVTGVYKNLSKDGCTGLDVKNTGGQAINNVAFYLKDYLSGKTVGSNGTNPSYVAYVNITSANPGSSERFSILALGTGNWTKTNIKDFNGITVQFVAIGDANNDGNKDVVISVFWDNAIRVYENKSGGWQETNISSMYPDYVRSVAIGDADNDGKNEVVIGAGYYGNQTRMYKNTTGKWVETNISDFGYYEREANSVAIGDANNDGKNEIVVGVGNNENFTGGIRMYENKSGGWQETNISNEDGFVNSVAIGDADNDGKNEIVIGGDFDNGVKIYKNESSGWIGSNISGNVNLWSDSVAIGDADNDGKNEVVIGTSYTPYEVIMYTNTSGKWVETNISDEPTWIFSVAIGDANNDGKNDVVIGMCIVLNEVRMYENKSGGWQETNISDLYNSVNSVTIGDAKNDGKNEVVIGTSYDNNEVRMYQYGSAATSIPFGTYILRTSSPGFSDQIFTCA
jgi:flagellin-like protein